MTTKEIKEKIIDSLSLIGIFVDCNEDEDVNLSEYVEDSITFVQFIVEIEDQLEINIPDELLSLSLLDSLCGFAEMLAELKIS